MLKQRALNFTASQNAKLNDSQNIRFKSIDDYFCQKFGYHLQRT